MFRDGQIEGVVIRPLKRYSDERGWLMEAFRKDELDSVYLPAMAYVSMTRPGKARGPHEHMEQADYFCFAGPSDFRVFLWDNREGSSTFNFRMELTAGESCPATVIVPRRVVHAYKNIGDRDGLVINCPNRLFKGDGRNLPVDEVRYENVKDSPYRVV